MGIILLYYQHTLKNGSPSFCDNEIYTSDMTGDITYEIYILFGIIRTMY